ncbi:MalY/PatB family protein [Abyssisolibacter fermentans]|uniref:MalY/PatB family protein n=1 Tax=Abyssisolibacter fermentans TaxID=1766203 RepID=UPI000835B35A|nr:aminotransferase class I/II-fold pyridoxal phosphate-dependent enzyme [Abyssisolibacter fermentans]
MYNFEELLYRENNGSMKWNKEYIRRRFPKSKDEIFPLFIADMDYKLPKEIVDSFIEFIQQSDFGYYDILDDYYKSIINWYKKIHHCSIENSWIIPGIGTITSIYVSISILLNNVDNVLIFTPVYGPFRDVVDKNNCNLIKYPLKLKHKEYVIDFKELEKSIIRNNISSILFCSPHNPSGKIWSKSELDSLIYLCKKYNLTLFVDEVHSDLVIGEKEFISMANYFNEYENIIISSSPNKTFNLAGLNASYLLTPNQEFKGKIEEGLKNRKLNPNRVGYRFLVSCYEKGERWVYELRNNIKENYILVKEILTGSDIEMINHQAGYLLWIKLNKVNDIDKFVIELAQDTGVLLETGSRFVDNYENFVRVNLATSKDILREAMRRFKSYYDNK